MINKLAEEVREAEETDEDDVIVKVWLSTKYPLQFKPTYVPSTVNWTDEDGFLCHYDGTSVLGLPCISSWKPGKDENKIQKVTLVALHVIQDPTEVASQQDMCPVVAIQ